MGRQINRREFLRTVAIGSAAAVSLPSFITELVPTVQAASVKGVSFHFLSQSKASPVGSVDHRITMSGKGTVDPSTRQVNAEGSFTHFDNSGLKDPKPILASGAWTATRLSSFDLLGTWGQGPFAAGVIEMDVTLAQDFPSQAMIPAMLKLVSNIGSAGLSTGHAQGFTLTIPGVSFGAFVPLASKKKRKGLTVFITRPEKGKLIN